MELDEIDTPKDWPEHVREFLTLEQLLRCEICFKFFTNCMMTSCSHNFCSLCIRKHLGYKSTCPICFKETIEPALRSNRLIDEVVKAFFNARSKLITMLKEPMLDQNVKQPFYRNTLNNKRKEVIGCDGGIVLKECSTMEGKPQTESNTTSVVGSYRLPLPKRSYLPKIVYHLMKEKDIRDLLKQAGLTTKGKREDLVRRHKQYAIMYNAECDSVNPRPDSELVKEVEEEEKMRQTLSNKSQKSFTTHRRSNPDAIEMERQCYVQSHSNEYQKLIAEIKNRHIAELACEQEVTILPTPSKSSLGKQRICIEISSDSSDSESNASYYNPYKDQSDISNITEETTGLQDLDETLLLRDCQLPSQSTLASVMKMENLSEASTCYRKHSKVHIDHNQKGVCPSLVDPLKCTQTEQHEVCQENVPDTSRPQTPRKRKTAGSSTSFSDSTGNEQVSNRRMSLRKRNLPPPETEKSGRTKKIQTPPVDKNNSD